jgi:hypothetical protein
VLLLSIASFEAFITVMFQIKVSWVVTLHGATTQKKSTHIYCLGLVVRMAFYRQISSLNYFKICGVIIFPSSVTIILFSVVFTKFKRNITFRILFVV